MANTVNDVMNVIASPDYGIKNIAGTNQEILAVLLGVHNSKNNLHNIVDDIRSLLQNLVQTTTNKKPIEVDSKSIKPNHKHVNVKDILDETKGIKKSIDNLSKSLTKQSGTNMPSVAKLTDKASQKVADAMVKSMEKQNKGGSMSAIVDAFTKLKNISLKDILLGKRKIKIISNIFKNTKKDLDIKEEELDNIIKLINASPEIIKVLSKISKKVEKITKNDIIKKISDILIGKNSLLSLSHELQKNKNIFIKANKISKDIKELSIELNKAMMKLLFASLKVKNGVNGVKNIESTINKLIYLSEYLVKNKKVIENGIIVAKNITTLAGNLVLSSIFLTIGATVAAPAILGAKLLTKMVDKTISLAKKLSKNKSIIDKGAKVAKDLSIITGNLVISSIFLTIGATVAVPAMLGAIFLRKMVDIIIPIFKKLSKNNRYIKKAIPSSLGLIVITGCIAVTSLILAKIAKTTGLSAILGSILVLGIVSLNVLAFKMLGKAFTTITKGAISMAVMSLSLLLFSSTLNKIVNTTKNVTFKQVGMIAALTVVLGGSVAVLGIPALFPFILLGSISMSIIGFALRPFAKTLGIITKETKNLKFKDIILITGSMMTLALGISALSFLLVPVLLGNITLKAINKTFGSFVRTLKIIHDMGTIPTKQVNEVLNVMGAVGKFFKENTLKIKTTRSAKRYKKIMNIFSSAVQPLIKLNKISEFPTKLVNQVLYTMGRIASHYINNPISKKEINQAKRYKKMLRPFGNTIRHLAKLKELGEIPMSLVQQTIDTMNVIANYYTNNPISKKAIKQAKRYKKMLRPFGNTIRHLAKLKELGEIPMSLVQQTIDTMNVIANYYTNNPISKKAIKQAKRYKKMLRPFGNTIKNFIKLKELGEIPMSLVQQTIDTMNVIANYYTNNPISKKAIKQAKRYKKMLRPFGNTIKNFIKLKELGEIPMSLVHQTIDAMSAISKFYIEQKMGLIDGKKAKHRATMIVGMLSGFGKAVEILKTLKELQYIPTETEISKTTSTINNIISFFKNISIINDIDLKGEFTKLTVDKFTDISSTINNKLANIQAINIETIKSITRTFGSIIDFYTHTKFLIRMRKVLNMNETIKLFLKNADGLKNYTQNFTSNIYHNVKHMIKSMKQIMLFLKTYSLTYHQRKRAKGNITLLRLMSSAMSDISNINPLNISSIGDALTNALSGVNSVDISQVKSVTDMFNAFNAINKSENIINKFTESVNSFTTACKNLMNAMGTNTEAINNIDFTGAHEPMTNDIKHNNINNNNNIANQTEGIRIINADEIAKSIAEKINGALYVDIPDTQVQLLINGQGGNEWTISKY